MLGSAAPLWPERRQAIIVTRAVQQQRAGNGVASTASLQNPRVLVIDDGAEALELYGAFLEYHGFEVDVAADGVSGLAKARATRPDAIVLDYSMPRMDGEQVLSRLREDPCTQRIPVLMLTAVPELLSRRTRAECTALLEKPCEPDRLASALHALVGDRGRIAR
jgi:CheY-like chemotaxis protein